MDGDYDCVVVGGGVTGLMTALRLRSSGWRVVVIEHDRLGSGATLSNHGIVHSGALFAMLHPEIVAACYAAQTAYEASFPTAVVSTLPAWYIATSDRLTQFRDAWDRFGIPHKAVATADLETVLSKETIGQVDVAQVRELVVSTRDLIADLTARCEMVGVELWTSSCVTQVAVEAGKAVAVMTGRHDLCTRARNIVLCCGIGTREILDATGSELGARLKSRLDMMVSLPNIGLSRPIMGLEFGWPTLAPTHGGIALGSRYGGPQPPVDGRRRWPVPVDEASMLVSELRSRLQPGLLDFHGGQAWVCSKTEYTAGAADAWGVEPNYAIIDHGHTEGIKNLWTVLPGKMTLALHASREVAERLTGEAHDLALMPMALPATHRLAASVADNPWSAVAHREQVEVAQ